MAVLKPTKSQTLDNGLVIYEFLLNVNNPNKIAIPAKRTKPLIGVTLHNTGWIDVTATTPAEQYTRATYNGNMGEARVHYFVDDKCAWRNFSDDYTTWHAATGGNGPGNTDTISIECIMKSQSDSVSVASMENVAKLIAYIFKTYNWTVEKNLYTHNYWTNYLATGKCNTDLTTQNLTKVSTSAKNVVNGGLANSAGKYCPIYILPQWDKFKALVNKYLGSTSSTSSTSTSTVTNPTTTTPTTNTPTNTTTPTPYMVKVTASALNIRKGPGSDYVIVGTITTKGCYTIVEESNGIGANKWGKLKSGAGWIALDYTTKL